MENGMAKVRDSSSDRQTELVVCAGRSFHGVKITPAMQHGDGAIVYIYHPLIPRRLSVEPESEAADAPLFHPRKRAAANASPAGQQER